ncbi:MAG: hypothetical protein NT038_00120 [Euryarchaeota archaeon]|nr:hypothetical protein [Euryarchaeota archaeon]
MQRHSPWNNFIQDEKATSEEFTSLPALTVVVIGFTLFVALLARTYSAYETRADILENYKITAGIVSKLTNPNCLYIRPGGIVDLATLQTLEGRLALNSTRHEYQNSSIDFIVRINWNNIAEDFPIELPETTTDRVAVSTFIDVYLNEACTIPAKFTVILWRID